MLIDTHCHIHDKDYPFDIEVIIRRAHEAGVEKMICVGTDSDNSTLAVSTANRYDGVFAAVGVHPHETKHGMDSVIELLKQNNPKIIAIGEIGLDYFYDYSPRDTQKKLLEQQLQLAVDNNLPVIFHIREGYDDFWPIIDNFSESEIRAVMHSFTDSQENLEKSLSKGYYIGLNGLCTFIKDEKMIAMLNSVPLDKMLLETDAPYLTPKPFRGKVNEPAYVKNIAEFIANSRGITVESLSKITSKNACDLFRI
jgi:TatD DNase family protein